MRSSSSQICHCIFSAMPFTKSASPFCCVPLPRAFAVCLYVQQRSELQAQQLQARNKQQGGGGGGRENYGSGRREAWKLHFSEKLADDCWVLSNGELRGKLWSDKTQVRERVATNTLF